MLTKLERPLGLVEPAVDLWVPVHGTKHAVRGIS